MTLRHAFGMLLRCTLNLSGKTSPIAKLALGAVENPREPIQDTDSSQNVKEFGGTDSSKNSFIAPKDSSVGFADFNPVSVVIILCSAYVC